MAYGNDNDIAAGRSIGIFMAYGNDNDIAAMRPATPEQLKAYEQARMAQTRSSTGMVGGLGSSQPPPEQRGRLMELTCNLDQLVGMARGIAERLESAVARIHGEAGPTAVGVPPTPEAAQGLLGNAEMFTSMTEQALRRVHQALNRLEEVA